MGTNTSPTFFRRFEVFVSISKILEPVTMTVGVSGPVDDESGMILNLATIDYWIETFKSNIKKRKYTSQWAFAKKAKSDWKDRVSNSNLVSLYFKFQERELRFEHNEKFIVWNQPCQIKEGRRFWKSDVHITMNWQSEKWPAITESIEKRALKKWKIIDLKKNSIRMAGLHFFELKYFDPKVGCQIILK